MTRGQAVVAALEIDRTYLTPRTLYAERDHSGVSARHLRWMVAQMFDGMSENKTMRWLGYIQGVLVAQGVMTRDEMKELSLKVTHE